MKSPGWKRYMTTERPEELAASFLHFRLALGHKQGKRNCGWSCLLNLYSLQGKVHIQYLNLHKSINQFCIGCTAYVQWLLSLSNTALLNEYYPFPFIIGIEACVCRQLLQNSILYMLVFEVLSSTRSFRRDRGKILDYWMFFPQLCLALTGHRNNNMVPLLAYSEDRRYWECASNKNDLSLPSKGTWLGHRRGLFWNVQVLLSH